MTVIEMTKPGGPEVLVPGRRPLPMPKHDEILIKVTVAGVNKPDSLQRAGAYPPPPGASDLLGLEVAGTVAAMGAGVTDWKIGDEVCALTPGGGYAEYCVTPSVQALPVPAGFSMVEAGALPETFFTVWHNVFERGDLKAGETFLVHGGSSGIGTTAIQLARAFGARVLATAGSADKCLACEKLGAERAIDYKAEDFEKIAKDMTGGKGVDLILDMVGGDYTPRNLRTLAPDGRLVLIATLGGRLVDKFDLTQVMAKRLIVTGSTLRPQSIAAKARIARGLRDQVWPMLALRRIAPVIDSTFKLTEAAAAHARLDSSVHIGKIVLTA
ncbi:MAG: NAD(P)H-quinone oxidoreductase [Alphaproteobacteria bacterium]|nr:NAD(P)H-quinone oxidoreductase [Alphaproteobacteria bacterium]